MLRHQEFDVCELSLAAYLVARDRGAAYTAIPVFPHRRFRHGYVVKRMNCGIDKPADLNGKRVGLDTLQNSAGLWMRGILQDHYGVDLKTIEWWCQEEEDVPLQPAAWMKVRRVPHGRDIDGMLLEGELEAAIYPETLPSIRSGSAKAGLLFPETRKAEIDYYRESGVFPIMHTVVIRRDVYERDRWIAQSLVKALTEAKRMCAATIYNTAALPYMLPWMNEEIESVRQLMGEDWWPYGLEPNRETLETFLRYAAAQGIAARPLTVEALFAPESLDTFKI
jgi:4,5-dihydroxyphthalate decarboxylase